VSWAWALNEQSRAALLRLDVWLQEETLDELDRLAERPGQLRRSGTSPICVADFTRDHGHERHYVFLSIELNPSARSLEVVGIATYSRPA
jgi:hypothetical protein